MRAWEGGYAKGEGDGRAGSRGGVAFVLREPVEGGEGAS
jgi:hypothetical protein